MPNKLLIAFCFLSLGCTAQRRSTHSYRTVRLDDLRPICAYDLPWWNSYAPLRSGGDTISINPEWLKKYGKKGEIYRAFYDSATGVMKLERTDSLKTIRE